jgi:hypothetical protein
MTPSGTQRRAVWGEGGRWHVTNRDQKHEREEAGGGSLTTLIFGSGKWQQRIAITLLEAGGPLSIRQLRMRCGMLDDESGSKMRMALRTMVKRKLLRCLARGLYVLNEEA